jgi:5-methylthioadenosine/S-adenosylhomocysteine deaminase
MKKIWIGAAVLPMTDDGVYYEEGALGVEDEKIIYVGKVPEPEELAKYDEVIRLKEQAILPGFVNTHGHAGMTLLRGYGDDLPLQEWLEKKMWPLESRFGARQVRAGTALAILEMLKSGTTCFLDMYDYMEEVAQLVVTSGLRGVLCRGVIGLGSEKEQEEKLQDAIAFSKNWHLQGEGRVTVMLSPHAPYTCSPDLIKRFVDAAAQLSLPIHTHMSETKREVEQNVHDYGQRPVAHLHELGVFDIPCLVAHAVHVNEDEIELLAQQQVKVAHNPRSNLKLGSGIAPIPQMLAKGIRPGLATDGAASNNRLNLLDEVQIAALIHKGNQQNAEVIPAYTALQMGTLYGAESLFLEQWTGSLEVGKHADFIVVDLNGPHLQPYHQLVSNLVYAATGEDIRDVYVKGKQLVRDGEALTLDEEKIKYQANAAIQALL